MNEDFVLHFFLMSFCFEKQEYNFFHSCSKLLHFFQKLLFGANTHCAWQHLHLQDIDITLHLTVSIIVGRDIAVRLTISILVCGDISLCLIIFMLVGEDISLCLIIFILVAYGNRSTSGCIWISGFYRSLDCLLPKGMYRICDISALWIAIY